MTLIVGIICKDGIVLAADSQTTWGDGKSWNARKMTELRHSAGRALVAESGSVLTSSRAVEELQRLCEMGASESFATLLETALRSVRNKLREAHFNCSSEELQAIIRNEGLDCALMVACNENGKPAIYTASLTTVLTNRCKAAFEVLGSGSNLAGYLLSDLCVPNFDLSTATLTAVHVVETVKRHDQYCGGPTRLGLLQFNKPKDVPSHDFINNREWYTSAPLIRQDFTNDIVKMVLETEAQIKDQRGALVREALEKFSREVLEDVLNDIKRSTELGEKQH